MTAFDTVIRASGNNTGIEVPPEILTGQPTRPSLLADLENLQP